PAPDAAPAFAGSTLELAELDDGPHAGPAPTPKAAAAPQAPDSWSLVEEGDAPTDAAEGAAAFGIHKVSAADYLAPEGTGGEDDSPVHPGLSLELVALEEAIAPQAYEPGDTSRPEPDGGLGRLVVLGAGREGTASVCAFLAGLPAGLPVTVLHTQHVEDGALDALLARLAEYSALPVRRAAPGLRVRAGEVLVVPAGGQVQLRRDGSLDVQTSTSPSFGQAPSIDASFTMAANVFGRDALAILFAGRSTDAVGGCQAIHDRGGRVWVETAEEHFADMVSAVAAERLSHHAGTPQELAARLVEELSTENQR
ncbi:chemotaxis protein CheB, partial [Frateuria defendens]|uniref:chemotaxis protein CheB n=1 Tax=Frateuria defendens TaxID=2219559 RepID=UPI0013791716